MHVTFRPGVQEDVAACLRLLPPGFVCEPGLRAKMLDMWRRWLHERCCQLTVLEDGARPVGQRTVAFGVNAYITDDFMAELRSGLLPPSPARHVVARHLTSQSPILSREAVRRANSGLGLNALVLHIGWDEATLTSEETRWVKAKLLEAFSYTIGGYQIKEVIQEVYSEEEMRRGLAAGALLRTDYAHFLGDGPLPPPPLRPYLTGNSRAEVQDGSTIAPLFFYTQPRIFFTEGEQDVLIQALLGWSDAELASGLHISPSTVQKRWRAIYERAAAVAPDLFPHDMASSPSPQTRGTEKRRYLLAYLRHHPEELRPVLPPKGWK